MMFAAGFVGWLLSGCVGVVLIEKRRTGMIWVCAVIAAVGFLMMLIGILQFVFELLT